jgi:signal transduction histidine kinase
VVVRPQPILEPAGARLADRSAPGAEPLGAAFPAAFAVVVDGPVTGSGNAGELLVLVVLLALGLTAVSAFLLWRDVRREVALAELRTQFVNGVSHELRTPLAAIRMNSDLLRLGIVPVEEGEECLQTIARETERLSRLIDNVLDFSRLERGELTYRMRPVDLAGLASELQRSVADMLQRDGFDLHVHVDPDLPSVNADPDALTQAVMNLLSNAVKFSGEARRIELALLRGVDQVVIQVTDHGCGISASARNRVFEKFYRAPEAQAAGIPGAGIGLALVADIVRKHGGSVSLDSEPGRGSVFTISLPARA